MALAPHAIALLRLSGATGLLLILVAAGCGPGPKARPILYADVEEGDLVTRVVTRVVEPDGRQLDTVVPSIGVTWSPDGTQMAYVTPGGFELRLADLTGAERTIYNSPSQWHPMWAWPTWSPDGQKIAVVTIGWCEVGSKISSLVVIDAEAGRIDSQFGPYGFWEAHGTEYGPTRFTMPKTLKWSPDGEKILVSWDKVVVLDTTTGKTEYVSDAPAIAEWAPGSDAVFYIEIGNGEDRVTRSLGSFYVRRLGDSSPVTLADADGVRAAGLASAVGSIPAIMALSPDGSTLAAAAGPVEGVGGILVLYKVGDPEALALDRPNLALPSEGPLLALDWSPDGRELVALVVGEEGVALRALDLGAEEWRTLARPRVDVEHADVLPKILSWAG